MSRFRSQTDTLWHLLLITLLGSPLITPLLRWTAVPCTHDGHLHYHRIVAMRHAWENGLPFTRWLPDLAFGYGYPFFVYREPIPLYAGLIPHLLGLSLPAASNLLYIVAILAGGWFMYLWVRDIFDSRAGLVAGVAYMAAPYVLIDALVRGNAPESVALPLFPLLLWLGRRWLLRGGRWPFVTGVLALALLSLSHNISLLIFTPTLLIYLLVIAWVKRLPARVTAVRLLLFFGLGLGMTAFYTGGALLEMDQVTLQQSTTTRNNDFHYNFASLEEILAPVAPEDPTLLNPPLPFRLGWVPVGLALLGVATFFARRLRKEKGPGDEQSAHVVMMVAGTAVYLSFALPLTLPLWENVPLIDFIQFPWRFVGRAALPVAFLAGVPFTTLRQNRSRINDYGLKIAAVLAVALLLIEAFPLLYPRTCSEQPYPNINKVHRYEQGSGLVGVDPEGSYFPRTVDRRPRSSPLLADYQARQTPQRFDITTLPEDAIVQDIEYGRLAATVRLDTPAPFIARYLSFAFPGWTATVDGHILPITPSDPEGLITFPVPSGSHTIIVRWQSTPLRTTLLGLSLMALAGAVVTAVILPRRKRISVNGHRSRITDYGLLLTAVLLLGGKLLLADRVETPLRRVGTPPVSDTAPLQGAELRLAGYTLSRDIVPAGGTFDIDLAWTAVSHPSADYQSNVWLTGPEGLIWSAKGTERPRLYEEHPNTHEWPAGAWAWDSREVPVYAGAPPGQYDIVLTLFDKETLQPLTLVDGVTGARVGPTAVIGQITVTMPDEPPSFNPQYSLAADLPALGLRLLGYNQDRAEAIPGEQLLLTLFWERIAPADNADFLLEVQNEAGEVFQSWTLPLTRSDFPLAAWQPGQRLRGQHALRLSPRLASGEYRFILANSVPLGQITVNAPERIFTRPPMATAVAIPFYQDDMALATLAGYTLESCAEPQATCRLTLLWQADAEMETSYRIFVHLVDADGQIVAQSDAEPANWTRPTTGWLPGEYILDPHQFTLPDSLLTDSLALRVGLYHPDNGQRLQTETAAFATLPLPSD